MVPVSLSSEEERSSCASSSSSDVEMLDTLVEEVARKKQQLQQQKRQQRQPEDRQRLRASQAARPAGEGKVLELSARYETLLQFREQLQARRKKQLQKQTQQQLKEERIEKRFNPDELGQKRILKAAKPSPTICSKTLNQSKTAWADVTDGEEAAVAERGDNGIASTRHWDYYGPMAWEWMDSDTRRRSGGWYAQYPKGTRGKPPGEGKNKHNLRRQAQRQQKKKEAEQLNG